MRVALPAGPLREAKGKLRVIDRRTGGEAKFQVTGEDAILLVAKDVPAMGYAVFSVRPGEGDARKPKAETARPNDAGHPVLESRFYRLAVDPKTGGISSLIDKETGRELVDPSSPWKLNTYIYEQPEGGRKAVDDMTKRAAFHRWSPEATTAVKAEWDGPVARSLVVEERAEDVPLRSSSASSSTRTSNASTWSTSSTRRRRSTPKRSTSPSRSRSAKPKGGQSPSGTVPVNVRFEISDADMAPGKEQLPGTTLDWHTVQHWVEFSGKDARVVWSPVEAPLVEFGDINTGKWLTKLDLANAWVFSYAMNNYWMTNFKASQEGRVEFRYSLTSLPPGPAAAGAVEPDRVAPSRFGWEVHTPLAVAWLPAKNKGRFTTEAESFVSVDQPNVIVQALWLDADGTPVARLREIAGRSTAARLTSDVFFGFTVRSAGTHETKESGFMDVALKPFEIMTVKLAPGR